MTDNRALRVLIVDDRADLADCYAKLCTAWGHEARGVYDGKSCLQEVDTFSPDVLLLDMGLPDLNGYEVARILQLRSSDSKMNIFALSGVVKSDHVERCKSLGIRECLLKPVDLPVLQNLLASAKSELS